MRAYFKRHPALLAYVLVISVFVFGQVRQEQETSSRVHEQCLSAVDGRTVLRTIVTEAYKDNAAGDLTKVPGFADLDIATQTYFENLVKLTQGNGAVRDALLAKIPIPTCN